MYRFVDVGKATLPEGQHWFTVVNSEGVLDVETCSADTDDTCWHSRKDPHSVLCKDGDPDRPVFWSV